MFTRLLLQHLAHGHIAHGLRFRLSHSFRRPTQPSFNPPQLQSNQPKCLYLLQSRLRFVEVLFYHLFVIRILAQFRVLKVFCFYYMHSLSEIGNILENEILSHMAVLSYSMR